MDEAAKATKLARVDRTLSVDCPRCGVGPGERCQDIDTGLTSNLVHKERVMHWKQVRAEEARDAAGEAWQAGAYPSGVTDPAETSGPRRLA